MLFKSEAEAYKMSIEAGSSLAFLLLIALFLIGISDQQDTYSCEPQHFIARQINYQLNNHPRNFKKAIGIYERICLKPVKKQIMKIARPGKKYE